MKNPCVRCGVDVALDKYHCAECELVQRVHDMAEQFKRYTTIDSLALELAELATEVNDDYVNGNDPTITYRRIDGMLAKLKARRPR